MCAIAHIGPASPCHRSLVIGLFFSLLSMMVSLTVQVVMLTIRLTILVFAVGIRLLEACIHAASTRRRR